MTRPNINMMITRHVLHRCFYKSFAMSQNDAIDPDTSPLSRG